MVRVTTLAASGPGSLGEALSAEGPRIVVFEVGGVIDLGRGRLEIRNPFVTVAGQTAPDPGITIIRGGISIRTHDVIVTHLRVRPGEAEQEKKSGWEIDGITTARGAWGVIVDHCSTSWATDENLSASGPRFDGENVEAWRQSTSHEITFSNDIVAEGLSRSTHGKGEHSKGSLIHDNATRVSLIANLYFSNMDRNPLFKGGAKGVVVNNLIVNPGKVAIRYSLWAKEWGEHPFETGSLAIVGNVFRYGPSTKSDTPLFSMNGEGPCDVYLHDNVATDTHGAAVPELGGPSVGLATRRSDPPSWPDGLTALPANELVPYVEKNVGARPWARDAIDTRIVSEALAGKGSIIDSEKDVGGYPRVMETRRPFDPAAWDLQTMSPRASP